MKHLLLYLFILPFCVVMACSDDDGKSTPTLTVGKEIVDFKSEAGDMEIPINTNSDTWTAKSNQNWCTVVINSENLKITVSESEERLVREATIIIKAADQEKTIRVRQLGYEPAILIDQQLFTLEASGGDFSFTITTNVSVEVKLPDWIAIKPVSRAPAMVTTQHSYTAKATILDAERQSNIEIIEKLPADATADKKENPLKALVSVKQSGLGKYNGGSGEDIKGDIKIEVKSGTASSFQAGGGEIEKSFDGDYSSLYHSSWSNGGSNYFPITLTYNFEQTNDVDYLIYYPRSEGGNGRFKEVDIEYSEDGNVFTKLLSKDFQGAASARKVIFDQTVRAKSFRFIVKSGSGDGQGFASCAEMEFYAKDPMTFDYSTLFTDPTCSELKPGITEDDIMKCGYPFFKNIAYYMIKGRYPMEFRIDNFKAYPNPDIQAATHKTSQYSQLDNPTGISVSAGEKLIVLVGDTHGYNISLRVQNLDAPAGDGFGGVSYPLSPGINKLTMAVKGLVYVMYQTTVLEDPAADPIKIHFASGIVNGYFDSQKHQGRWSELINKATDRYFDVVGKYAHLTFETSDFKSYAGSNGDQLIDLYDKISYNQQQLLGLEKYGKMFKNRMYFNVMYHSYMYATSYHTGYERGTMVEVCNPARLKTGGCWGPAHEVGHVNQTRPGLKWLGTTEVTNNIMSEYIQTTIFEQDSRIQAEDMGINYRNRYSKAWCGIIAAKAPHANFQNLGTNDTNDVFCKLIPFWQLELYYGKVLGRTPLQQADKGGFYPEVYEYVRTHSDMKTPGEQQLEFVYICSLKAKANLLDFFTKWGFLTPVNIKMDDYGEGMMIVTQSQIDALKQRVEALGFSKPDVALEYISDNTVNLYKTKPDIMKGSNATHTPKTFTLGSMTYQGETLTIANWQNVVTYEVENENGQVIFICSGETTPSATDSFTIPTSWQSGYKLYAISSVGTRVEIPF